MTHFSNLSGLNVEREGTITKRAYKAHLAELQQRLRDLQEEIRQVTGGGRGQVPASATKKGAFRLSAPDTATADTKVEVSTSLRTTTKSRVQSDLVTRAELASSVAAASTATGFVTLAGDQDLSSGNKDFQSISFDMEMYTSLTAGVYPIVDLSGATFWRMAATGTGDIVVHSFKRPDPDRAMLRIIYWASYNANLKLVHNSTLAGIDNNGRIETLAAPLSTTTDTPIISTSGPGAFVLLYNRFGNRWVVVARNA